MLKDDSYSKVMGGSLCEILGKHFGPIIKTYPTIGFYFVGRLLAF